MNNQAHWKGKKFTELHKKNKSIAAIIQHLKKDKVVININHYANLIYEIKNIHRKREICSKCRGLGYLSAKNPLK